MNILEQKMENMALQDTLKMAKMAKSAVKKTANKTRKVANKKK